MRVANQYGFSFVALQLGEVMVHVNDDARIEDKIGSVLRHN